MYDAVLMYADFVAEPVSMKAVISCTQFVTQVLVAAGDEGHGQPKLA